MKKLLVKAFCVLLSLCLLLCALPGAALAEYVVPINGQTYMRDQPSLTGGVVGQLVDGDYAAVYAALRADVAAGTSADAIGELVRRQLEGAGTYKQIDSAMVTGQSSDGESYGVAVLYGDFSKKDVLFRLAFDRDMALIGMEIKQQ